MPDAEASVDIPQQHPEIPSLAYLGGHSLGELLATERIATAEALRRAGRPNATLHLPRVGPGELGQLFMRNAALPFDAYYAARNREGERGEGTFSKTL